MSTTYSACKVIITVAGRPIKGFGESDLVSVERDKAKFIKSTGADGQVSRSHVCDNAGQVQLTLQQTSKANDVLSELLLQDEATLAGQFAVTITDLNGTTNIIGADCWLTGPPTTAFSREIQDRVWTIDVADLYMFIGGNNGNNLINSAVNQATSAVGEFVNQVGGLVS